MSLIHFENISKSFKVSKRPEGLKASVKHFFKKDTTIVEALKDVSFEIGKGELVGYIGPNGAGKSTTVKIMSGILTPSEGVCRINGRVPWTDRKDHVADIGVVFGQRSQLWWDVPVMDSFVLLKDIYRIDEEDYKQMLADLTEALDLSDFLQVPVRQLSLGQRMRCELAASLLHNPPVLFLDEPTIGLDAVSKTAVRSFIRSINEKYKTTVILTTHDMDDIEALCSRVIVIGKGEKLYDGHLQGLRDRITRERQLVVDYKEAGVIPALEKARIHKVEGNRVTYRFKADEIKASDLIQEISSHNAVEDILVENVAIEEIIARLYKEMVI